MRVLIVGCGYVGSALGAELIRQGHRVWGVRRSAETNGELRALGIIPVNADITRPETLPRIDSPYDWVVYCVSSAGGDPQDYQRVYLEGAGHLLDWLSAAPPSRLVYTGSTSVYGQTDGSSVDEASPAQPQTSTGKILLRTEEAFLGARNRFTAPAIVLRIGAIYGPSRAYWLEQFNSGKVKPDGQGDRILNMVHRDDVAGAIIAALARGTPGEIYNVVDNEPVRQHVLFEWLSRRLVRTLPAAISPGPAFTSKRGIANKKVSNRKLREDLGYQLLFPSFREGFEQVLAG